MCKALDISRNTYYSYKEKINSSDPLSEVVIKIFKHAYGTRKLKVELAKLGYHFSRRRISKIMKSSDLVSSYTLKKYKHPKDSVNEEKIANVVNHNFEKRKHLEVVVSDLTYVRVKNSWHYICIILDLHNREIIGYSCGAHKNAQLVHDALAKIKANLYDLQIFHTDRGSEFKNYLIDDLLKKFNIQRSLSAKGCPYDNAVAESQFKIIKTEFVHSRYFETLDHLKQELSAYVYWFNNKRIHGALGYKTPVEFKQALL